MLKYEAISTYIYKKQSIMRDYIQNENETDAGKSRQRYYTHVLKDDVQRSHSFLISFVKTLYLATVTAPLCIGIERSPRNSYWSLISVSVQSL